jgi:lambda repressor-like predicted transcriptional regulator
MASTNLSAIERGTLMAWPKAKKAISKALKTTEGEIWPVNAVVKE